MRLLWVLAVVVPLAAHAQQNTSNQADGGAKPTDPYVEIVKRVQERLHANGYDIGAVDGVLDLRTQRAVAQFQLSQAIPAGGTLDDETLKALGVDMAEVQILRAGAASSASVGETAPQPK
jgi:peptidoglycan hydrolase-like protein with peptidoglycan-binding domain